jgi:hypothetical protein
MAVRQRLLETPAEQVSAPLAKLVADFCEPIPEIRTAFVGLTETSRDLDTPTRQLSVAFELSEPSAQTEEGDRELRLVAERFYASMPEDVQAGGCNFLEPGATSVWEQKARRVYPTSS